MELKRLFLGVIPALMLASCSSDEMVSDPQGPVSNGDGYIAVSINLPTQKATRALNDKFDDGTVNEYAVTDAAVLLFKGANQQDATFTGAYPINTLDAVDDADNDNITTSYLQAIKINSSNLTVGQNLYALVVLNYKNVLTIENNGCTVKDGDALSESTKFSDLLTKTSNKNFYNVSDNGSDYFFMTNAPIVNKAGGSNNPVDYELTYLTKLDGKVYPTEAEAKKSPSGSVYVERAVAKATLNVTPTELKLSESKSLTISDTKWAIGNYEETSYIVRNLGDLSENNYLTWTSQKLTPSNYRFVGYTPMGVTSIQPVENLYRTYWCKDPNYSTDKTYTQYGEFTNTSQPLYCYENTFDVLHQNYKNTTRAVIQVQFGNETFYTIEGADYEGQTFTENDAKSYPTKYIIESNNIQQAFKNALNPNQEYTIEARDLDIEFVRDDKGIYKVNSIAIKDMDVNDVGEGKTFSKQPNKDFTLDQTLISNVNDFYVISAYENGVSYYDVRFMHFASNTTSEDLAPWTWTDSEKSATTTEEAYGKDEQASKNYLGRYGMVRNNWYDLTITNIKKLGSPVVPDAKVDTSDDNNIIEKYIAFKINILSWAKRTQSVEL